MRRWQALVGLIAALLVAYPLAALILGLVPRGSDFTQDPTGPSIGICASPVHADLLLPIAGSTLDWRDVVPEGATPPPLPGDTHIAFGRGDAQFYMNTPRWADLRFDTAWAALFGGGQTALAVTYEPAPGPYVDCRVLRVDPGTLAALETFVAGTVTLGSGRAEALSRPHGPAGFVAANGRYSPLDTCNDWVRRALSHAGIRAPVWSPFPQALLFQLDQAGAIRISGR